MLPHMSFAVMNMRLSVNSHTVHSLHEVILSYFSLTCCTSGCRNTNKEAFVQMGCGGSVRKLRAAFLFAGVLGSFMKILK